MDVWERNIIELCGTISTAPALSHISKDKEYYVFPLEIPRLSGVVDTVNITAARELLEDLELTGGERIAVNGELRTFNNKSGQGSKLIISVFTRALRFTNEEEKNSVQLVGTLCKQPNLRRTPMGREICDLMLAVNRRYGRSDYLPCIAWGQNAQVAGQWEIGKKIKINGRIQSRKYIKIEEGESIDKTAYEISVISFDECDDLTNRL